MFFVNNIHQISTFFFTWSTSFAVWYCLLFLCYLIFFTFVHSILARSEWRLSSNLLILSGSKCSIALASDQSTRSAQAESLIKVTVNEPHSNSDFTRTHAICISRKCVRRVVSNDPSCAGFINQCTSRPYTNSTSVCADASVWCRKRECEVKCWPVTHFSPAWQYWKTATEKSCCQHFGSTSV